MTNSFIIIGILLSSFTFSVSHAQSFEFAAPDEILRQGEAVPEVLLVGTFHFGYPNQDAHKIKEEDQVDILSPQKQLEVAELVDYIARFQPTKIVVEAGQNSGYLVRQYERWQAGEEELRAQEIDQLAFRLMERFSLDTLYGCDAPGLTHTINERRKYRGARAYLRDVFEEYDWQSDDEMDQLYTEWYDQNTQYSREAPLLDYFKYQNSNEVIHRMHGAYLIGDFKLDEFQGADALALYWYSRNLRTFRRIQEIKAGPGDRVLVLFGAGHISILKQQFEASPEFELIDFSALENY